VIRHFVIVSAAVLSLVTAGWPELPQAPSSASSTKTPSPPVTVTDHDNGNDIDLGSNEALIVKLTSNPSTGYQWTVVGDPSPLKLQKATYRKNAKSSQAIGAPGVQVFQFGASSAGIANLNFAYRRSWEYNLPPAKTFSVRVNVR